MTLQEYTIVANSLVDRITRLKERLQHHNEKYCRACEEEFERKWKIKRDDQIMLSGATSRDTNISPRGTEYTLRCVYGGIVIYVNTKEPYLCLKKSFSPWYYKNNCNGRRSRKYIPLSEVTDVIKMPDKA